MKKEKIEKMIAELKLEKTKLIKIKSASPTEILERLAKIDKRISDLEARSK